MKHWIETYPHKIYASVLILDNKVMDYKIGERKWEHVYDVTLRGQIEIKDLERCKVKNTYWEVNNINEHGIVFNVLAKEWIEKQKELISKCKYCNNTNDEDISIDVNEAGEFVLSFDDGYDCEIDGLNYASIVIDYCPFCGNRLSPTEEELK